MNYLPENFHNDTIRFLLNNQFHFLEMNPNTDRPYGFELYLIPDTRKQEFKRTIKGSEAYKKIVGREFTVEDIQSLKTGTETITINPNWVQ